MRLYILFVEIIKNLSPQDAEAVKHLAYIRDSPIVPIISIDEKVMSIPNNSSHYCFLSDKYGFHEANAIISSLLCCGLLELNYVFSKNTNFQGFTFLEDNEEVTENLLVTYNMFSD